MLTPFSFVTRTAPYIDGWLNPAIQTTPIGLLADSLNFPHYVRSIKIPKLVMNDDLKFMPKLSQENCTFNKMGDLGQMSEDDMSLFPLNGEWQFCPAIFNQTPYAHYFRGGGVEDGDMTNNELGDFLLTEASIRIAQGANTLSFWGSTTATAVDYNTAYNGFWPSIISVSAASPTGQQAKRVTITQNTQIAAGAALAKLQALIYGQTQFLRREAPTSKAIICNTEFYDAVRTDLIAGTSGSNAYPTEFLNGMEFFTYQGIRVYLDPAITQHAQNTGFASINATNNFVYVAALVHTKNFVVATSIGENDAVDAYYSKDQNKTILRTGFNYGTYLRDGRYAVILA